MNRNFFEARFLVNVVGQVIRQDDLFPIRRQMSWERLYRLADYHNVANIVHLGMLGGADLVPGNWRDKFFNRYQEALTYTDIFERDETDILRALNERKVQTLILESSAIRKFYNIKESAGCSPARLYFDDESVFVTAKGILVDMGYATDKYYPAFGEHMQGPDGFNVEIYYHLPFVTGTYEKTVRKMMKSCFTDPDFKYVKTFSMEGSLVIRMAEMAYRYCSDALLIRDVLDTLLFYQACVDDAEQKTVNTWLKAFNVDELSMYILHLGALWFGKRKDALFPYPDEDMTIYDEMENRIITNGQMGNEKIQQALELREQILHADEMEEHARNKTKFLDKVKNKALAMVQKKERRKTSLELSDYKSGAEIEIRGDVTYTMGTQGAVIKTPYYRLVIPEFWMGRCTVSSNPFRENFTKSNLTLDKRDTESYALHLHYLSSDKEQDVPVLKIVMFNDINNAADRQNAIPGTYYLGRIDHTDGRTGRKFAIHLMGEIHEDLKVNGRDHNVFRNMQESVGDIISSITGVNDITSSNDRNEYTKFKDWRWGDMPGDYYFGAREESLK